MAATPPGKHSPIDDDAVSDVSLDSLPPYDELDEDQPPQSASLREKDQKLDTESELSRPDTESILAEGEYGFFYPYAWSRALLITVNDATIPDAASSSSSSKASASASGRKPIYYVEISSFTPNKPHVILHSITAQDLSYADVEQSVAAGKAGPVIGAARLPAASRHMRFSLGDPGATAGSMVEHSLSNPNILNHELYEFGYGGRRFEWRRTHDAELGVEGGRLRRALSRDSYALYDASTADEEMVAVFIAHTGLKIKRRGGLKFFDEPKVVKDRGEDFKMVVFLSIIAILEKARRRTDRRKGYGAGGGGGG